MNKKLSNKNCRTAAFCFGISHMVAFPWDSNETVFIQLKYISDGMAELIY